MILIKLRLSFIIISALILTSCKNDDDSINSCSIALNIEKNEEGILLSWDNSELLEYDGYVIERSRTSFEEPIIQIDTISVLSDISTINFLDTIPIIAKIVNYRLSAFKDGNSTQCAQNDIFLDYFFIATGTLEVAYGKKSDVLFLFESAGINNILRYDYQSETITHVLENIGGTNHREMHVGLNNEQDEEIYFVSGETHVLVIDADNMIVKDSIKTSFPIIDVVVDRDLIYLMASQPFSLLVYSKTTLDSLNHIYDDRFLNFEEFAVVPNYENFIGFSLRSQVLKIQFSKEGKILGINVFPINQNGGTGATEVVFSEDGALGIVTKAGAIVNEEFEFYGGLDQHSLQFYTHFTDFVFSSDGNLIYAFKYNIINKFSAINGNFIEEKELPYFVYRVFRNSDNKMVVVSRTYDSGHNIYVDVLDY